MAAPMDGSSSKSKRGGKYCVAGGPNGTSCKNGTYTEGISLHLFPQVKNTGTEADKEKARTRALWVKFVRRHRHDFEVTATSVLCSVHFDQSCYNKNVEIADMVGIKKRLKPQAIPTIDVAGVQKETPASTARARRQIAMAGEDNGLNHCKFLLIFAVVMDLLGVTALLVGIFAPLELRGRDFGDLLVYSGVLLVLISMGGWVMWYSGNIEGLAPGKGLGHKRSAVDRIARSLSRRIRGANRSHSTP